MNNRALRTKFFLLGLPSLAGFAIFYIFPFFRTLWYSVIDNTFQKNFVLFDNYVDVIRNPYFQLAVKNTFLFSLLGVLALVISSLLLSLGLQRLGRRFDVIRNLLVAPMLLPTASVIFVWQMVFQNDIYSDMIRGSDFSGFWTVLPVFLLYIWKNAGLNIIILSAAISGVSTEIQEAAMLDGAKGLRIFRSVTLPLITPSILFVIVLSFVNALRSFRESYLFFGTNYPPDEAYTVQYYMNNHFGKLNYPVLTSASVIFTVLIVAILLVMYLAENKYNERIY